MVETEPEIAVAYSQPPWPFFLLWADVAWRPLPVASTMLLDLPASRTMSQICVGFRSSSVKRCVTASDNGLKHSTLAILLRCLSSLCECSFRPRASAHLPPGVEFCSWGSTPRFFPEVSLPSAPKVMSLTLYSLQHFEHV